MKSFGFTLAEVLITLGIIGVVAAMTMPVIMANVSDKVLETQNKKAQSVFANGIKMLMAKDDVTNLQDTQLYNCKSDKACLVQQLKQVFQIIEEDSVAIKSTKYQFTNETKEVWNNSKFVYTFVSPDGIIFGILKNDDDTASVNLIADINGSKRPNKGSKDLCKYSVSASGTLTEHCDAMAEYILSSCSIENLEECSESECLALNDGSGEVSAQHGIWSGGRCYYGHSGGAGAN